MATDPFNPTLDPTRKPATATVDRRYRQPAVIPDNIPDDVEVVESETPQPAPQPVRRPRSFAPPDPSAEPETGTTGGYIPKQAGTWDGKPITTADLSGDRATRMEQIRQETERRARLQFEKERPFAPSGEFKGPSTRAIRDASIEGEQAYGDLQQQRRQQIADRREQMRFDQKTRNATKEEQFRSTGQQFYKDEFSELQPVLEAGTNRPLFSTTPKTLTKHPKTGEPVMEMRDKYGQRQYTRPKLVASDDPMDDRLYYDVGDGESIPAMTIEEAANHPDVSVAVRGKAARKRKMTAERNAATAKMEMVAESVGMQYNTAKMQAAAMKSRADALALQGGNPEEIAKLTDQAMALEDNLKPGTGALALQKEMADRALATERIKTKYDAHLLQRDEMATRIIARGGDPENDPLYRENEQAIQAFEGGLRQAEAGEAEIARLMQPLTGAPVAAPVPATAGQQAATAGFNILEGAGTGLVDMGEFVVRQLGRLGRLMQYGSREMEAAGVQPPGMEVAAEWANAMREVASEWGPEVTPEIRAQLEKGFLTGTAPKALGSAISFMLPTGLLGGAAKALNLSTKAMGGLAAAGVATAGAAGSGNAFRREAEAKLRPKLAKGEITQQDFERSLGMAEAFGAALGTTEAVPLGKFVQRIGGTVAGKGFLAKLFEKAARGGNGAAMKWLAGEGGEVLAETIEEGGQELVQSLSEDIYASQTFDPERKIGADTAESAAAGGLVGFLLSLATRLIGGRRLPPSAQPEGEQTPPPPGTPTTPAGTPPPAEGAATPSQNFPTADQTEAEQAQAELEAALVENQAAAEMATAQGETAPAAETAPVDIGPRDETVSTGTGVPTEKEQAILTEQQRLVDEHLAQQAAVEPVPVGQIQEPTLPGEPEAQPVAIPAPEAQQPTQTEETSNAATQGQQPANNQPEYPGTAQGTAVQENRPEVRQAEGEQAGGGNRPVGSEAGAAPAVRTEVARTPLPENLVAPDAAMKAAQDEWMIAVRAFNADKINPDEFDAARKKYQSAQAQYDAASNQEAIRVSEAPKRTIEQVKAERAQKGLGEPAPENPFNAPWYKKIISEGRRPTDSEQARFQKENDAYRESLSGNKPVSQKTATPEKLEGEKINREWTAFSDESKSLGIPRAEMPQVKAEHRGALTNFLKGRGITSEEAEVLPGELKPTQAEYSQAKVDKARKFEGGDRAILVSSDGHVLDGHHQWMAKLTDSPKEKMRVIRLNAPIKDLIAQVKEFPSAEVAKGATAAAPARTLESVKEARAKQATPAAPVAPTAAAPAVEAALGDQPVKLELRRSKTGEMVEVEMSAKRAEARVQKHIDTLTQVRNCLEGLVA